MAAVTRAAGEVDKVHNQDETTPPARDPFSGLTNLQNGHYHFAISRFNLRNVCQLPRTLTEQIQNVRESHFLGTLPEINRVYVTVDNQLFLWDYNSQDRWCAFNQMDDIIVSVGLVNTKPDRFINEVQKVLVVCTRLTISLFGLGFTGGNVRGELKVFPTNYRLPTDEVVFRKVVGTSDGRIFLCGDDGHVHEFNYEVYESLFGQPQRKCSKTNISSSPLWSLAKTAIPFLFKDQDPIRDAVVDESNPGQRRLYALTRTNQIICYILTSTSASEHSRNKQVINSACGYNVNFRHYLSNCSIVKIETIPCHESSPLNGASLCCVTNKGDRIFLDGHLRVKFVRIRTPHISDPNQTGFGGGQRRTFEPSVQTTSPNNVQTALYRDGVLLLSETTSSHNDVLITHTRDHSLENDTGGYNKKMNEVVQSERPGACADNPLPSASIVSLDEVPEANYVPAIAQTLWSTAQKMQALQYNVGHPLRGLSVFAKQHLCPSRMFTVLTSNALYQYELSRPVDELQNLLGQKARDQQWRADITSFFEFYGHEEACAMCLILACSRTSAHAALHSPLPSRRALTSGTSRANAAGALLPPRASMQSSSSRPFDDDEKWSSVPSPPTQLPSSLAKRQVVDAHVRSGAQDIYFNPEFGGYPHLPAQVQPAQFGQPQHQPIDQGQVTLSYRVNGLYRYLGRLLRPVWDHSVFVQEVKEGMRPTRRPRFLERQLAEIQRPIYQFAACLKEWLRDQKFLVQPKYTVQAGSNPADLRNAREREVKEIRTVLLLAERAIEGFHVMRKFADRNKFDKVYREWRQESSQYLIWVDDPSVGTFKALVTTSQGETFARAFINALVQKFPDDVAQIDELHGSCRHFFNKADVEGAKARELVKRANAISYPNRHADLEKALELYKRASEDPDYGRAQLQQACRGLRAIGFYTGVVDLALHVSEKLYFRDRQRQAGAQDAYMGGDQLVSANLTAQDCCAEIFQCFRELIAPNARLDQEDPALRPNLLNQTIVRCLHCHRKEFLYMMYGWFLEQRQLHLLYQHQPQYLEEYLQDPAYWQQAGQSGQRKERIQKLVEYYGATKEFEKQVMTLKVLALRDNADLQLTLQERQDFLARAKLAAQNLPARAEEEPDALMPLDGVFEIQDQLRITELQSMMKRRVEERAARAESQASRDQLVQVVELLDKQVFKLEHLYQFSLDNQVWDMALKCLEFGRTMDPQAVQNIWHAACAVVVEDAGYHAQDDPNQPAQDGREWHVEMGDKLREMGQAYVRDPDNLWLFPCSFLVALLEKYNVDYNPRPVRAAVVDIMDKIGVPVNMLVETYLRLFEQGWEGGREQIESCDAELRFQILYSVHKLLSTKVAQKVAAGWRDHNSASLDQMDLIRNARQLMQLLTTELAQSRGQEMQAELEELRSQSTALREKLQPQNSESFYLQFSAT